MPDSLNIIDFPANSPAHAPGDIEYFRRPGADYTAPTVTPVNPVTSPPVPDPIHLPDGTELRLTLSKKLWLNRLFGDDADHWDGPEKLLEHVSVIFLAACPPEVFRRIARCPETGQMLPLIRRPYDFQTALDAFADTYLDGYTIDEIESLSREFWEQQHCTRVIAKKKIPLHSPADPPPPMTTMTPTPYPPIGASNSSTSPPAATPSAAATCSTTCPSPSSTPKSTPPSTPPTSPPSAPPPPSPATPASPPPSPPPRLLDKRSQHAAYIAALQAAGHVLAGDGDGNVDIWKLDIEAGDGRGHNGPQCTLCGEKWCIHCRDSIIPCPAAHPDNEPLTEVNAAADYEAIRRITAAWPAPSIGETRIATIAKGTSYTLTGRRINELTASGEESYLTWDLGGLCFGKWPCATS